MTLCERFGIAAKRASPEFWEIVTAYQWPGNVRELIQALEKALLSAKEEPMLFPKHLPTYIRIQVARGYFPQKPAGPGKPEIRSVVPKVPPKLKEIREAAVSEAERRYLKDLISLRAKTSTKRAGFPAYLAQDSIRFSENIGRLMCVSRNDAGPGLKKEQGLSAQLTECVLF